MMFCHNCGAPLQDGGKFCSNCGKTVGSLPATVPRSRRSVRILLLIGVLAVLLVIWGRAVNDQEHSSPPESSLAKDAAINGVLHNVQQDHPSSHSIGATFSVGYWAYTVNSARWQSMLVSLGGSIDLPDAKFLVVDVSVCNRDRTASTLPPFKLVDDQGREYDASTKGSFLPGAFDVLKQLNPGVYSRGLVVFDAPPHRDYSLKVSGGFESGTYALVDLSTSAPQSDAYKQAGSAGSSTPPGQHHFVEGVLANVHCDNPVLDLNVISDGKSLSLHTDNYFDVQFTVIGARLKGDINPCADLEGRSAKVEYAESSTGTQNVIVSVEIHDSPDRSE